MESSIGFLLALAWVILRFGLPILFTSLISLFLSQIDSNWEHEALLERKNKFDKGVIPFLKCWVFNDCPPEKRANCPAYQEKYLPCWQIFRDDHDNLQERCLGCPVFLNAPVPIIDSN